MSDGVLLKMVEIGNIELPIVAGVNPIEESEVSEIQPSNTQTVAVKHEAERPTIIITGFLNQELHSSSLSIQEQKSHIKNLSKKETIENSFNYRDWKGHLLIENVDFDDNSDSRIINEVEIEAKYHPWPQFYPENEP
jgi:hypothetical protein